MSRMADFGFWLSRTFATTKPRRATWPHVPGKYFVVDPAAPVAVATLGSVDLAEQVAAAAPRGLCIAGKVETENIGIEKIIKNVIANPAIRYLVCAGAEPPMHLTGATMIALFENGVDEKRRIPGSPGMRPVLPNTTDEEVELFRSAIIPVDMIGCTDVEAINTRVGDLAEAARQLPTPPARPVQSRSAVECIVAEGTDPKYIKLDRAGYFVINLGTNGLIVEHYDYRDRLLRVIEGGDARSIYLTLIKEGWVSSLDHAAYLGKELARAEAALASGSNYVQDGA